MTVFAHDLANNFSTNCVLVYHLCHVNVNTDTNICCMEDRIVIKITIWMLYLHIANPDFEVSDVRKIWPPSTGGPEELYAD